MRQIHFKMKCIQTLFLLLILNFSRSQIHFPVDTPTQNNYENFPLQSVPLQIPENEVDKIISRGIIKLTLQIANSLAPKIQSSDNTIYSPLNIAAILALILLGSNGKTFEEVSNVMGLASGVDIHSKSQLVHEQLGRLLDRIHQAGDPDEIVKLASALFVQEDFPIRSVYKQISENVYKSDVKNLDFMGNAGGAKESINGWVRGHTNGKINAILHEDPPTYTKVIIVGALYFRGAWEKPFFSESTRRRPFFPDGRKSGKSVMADMMSNGGLFPYYKDPILDCEIMGFPYKGNRTTMYVIMPNHSDRNKLRQLQNQLTTSDLENLIDNVKYTQAVILFPKMRLETSLDLTKSLMDLGVKSLFLQSQANLALLSPGRNYYQNPATSSGFVANVVRNPSVMDSSGNDFYIFSRSGASEQNCTEEESGNKCKFSKLRKARQVDTESLDGLRSVLGNKDNPGLYVDQVLHKVYMDITETGTEAAAATSASLSRGGDIVTFRVDQPFLFFIRNQDTKAILFWGSVNSPTPHYS